MFCKKIGYERAILLLTEEWNKKWKRGGGLLKYLEELIPPLSPSFHNPRKANKGEASSLRETVPFL
jgi:hypothetical protein